MFGRCSRSVLNGHGSAVQKTPQIGRDAIKLQMLFAYRHIRRTRAAEPDVGGAASAVLRTGGTNPTRLPVAPKAVGCGRRVAGRVESRLLDCWP